jgi:hypothetical protein
MDEEDMNAAAAGNVGAGSNYGEEDSGWVRLQNGTYTRKQSSWSSETSYGSGRMSQEQLDQLHQNEVAEQQRRRGMEDGSRGRNATGWVRQPDGTMARKSNSWSSWSKTSQDPDEIEQMRRELEQKRSRTSSSSRHHDDYIDEDGGNDDEDDNDALAPNVEPGFEARHKRKQSGKER